MSASSVTAVAVLSFAAFAAVFGRRFQDVPPLVTAAGQTTGSTVLLLPLVLVVDRPWTLVVPGPGVWAAIVGLALLSTALAYVLYFTILKRVGASNLLLVTFLIPVSAVTLGTVFLGETLLPRHLMGAATIGMGLLLIDGRVFRLLRARAV